MSRYSVHNHGPEDGPGLACQEMLIGACELARLKAQQERLRDALLRANMALELLRPFNHALADAEMKNIAAALAEAGEPQP